MAVLFIFEIHFPPLRERPEAMEYLCRYQWKGNIRELENVVQYMISMNSDSESGIMGVSTFPAQIMEDLIDF
ncbi:MAG: hypothetical protein E7244_15010 [Enterocloster citroniae]|nr:hypothetical protein [Enterocloster citroniae]